MSIKKKKKKKCQFFPTVTGQHLYAYQMWINLIRFRAFVWQFIIRFIYSNLAIFSAVDKETHNSKLIVKLVNETIKT